MLKLKFDTNTGSVLHEFGLAQGFSIFPQKGF